ncbi:MAG: ribosome maturation factor RimP [Candidatus Firestonebacteria bacterium]
MSIAEKVKALIKPMITEVELVDVEYKKEGSDWFLRVYIDKPCGVTVDDCKAISNTIEPLIDVENILQNKYFLEVSSPGLTRPLKSKEDFKRNIGKLVDLNLYASTLGQKQLSGIIKEIKEEGIILEFKDKNIQEILLSNVAKATLVI